MITNRMIRKGIDNTVWSGGLVNVFISGISGPVIAGLVIVLGFSKFQIGLLTSMMVLFLPMQLIGALIQKRYFNRKRFWLVGTFIHYLGYATATAILVSWNYLSATTATVLFIGLIGLSHMSAQLVTSSWFAWVGELVPQKESATFWSRKEGVGRIAMLLAALAFGFSIDWMGKDQLNTYVLIFAIAVAFGFASLWLQGAAVDPDLGVADDDTKPFRERLRDIFSNKNYRILVWAFSFYSFFFWLLIPFYFVYMQETLGMSMTVVQVLVAVGSLSSFICAYFFKIIGSKYGMKPVMMMSLTVKIIECLLWVFIIPGSSSLLVFITAAVSGFSNMGVQIAQFSMLTSSSDKENSSFAVAIFFGVTGLVAFAAGSISGGVLEFTDTVLSDSVFSAFNLLHLGLTGACVVCLAMFWQFCEQGGASTVAVIKNLTQQNPFRTIYHAHVLSQPMHEEHRLKALSKTKGNLVAGELLHDIYSPSTRIREAAIYSISKLGTKMDRALVDELIKIMDYPELLIQAPAARALGHAKVKEAVPVLIKHMYSSDLTLAQSCVFALGLIADKKYVDELSIMLDREQHRALWSTATEAIGKVGNYRHAKSVYTVYRHEYDWVLRKQALISMVNTIIGKSGFYNAIEREEKSSGVEVEARLKLINALLKTVDRSQYTASRSHIASANNHFDRGGYLASAEACITALFNVVEGYPELTQEDLQSTLGAMFNHRGKLKYKPFLHQNYKATVGWLIVSLWGELKYSSSDFDKYIHLTILWLVESVLKHSKNPLL